MRHWLRSLESFALDLLFPLQCLGCRQEGVWLCRSCLLKLPQPPQRCPFCTRATPCSETCSECGPTHALASLTAVTIYHHPIPETLLRGLKYRYWSSAAPTLGVAMAEAMSRRSDITLLPPAQIVPIPLHPSRERERGFNQAALLGQGLAQALNLPFTDTLQRIRKTRSQATLSERERGPNIQGAFGAKKGLVFSKKNVILVDDVSTTGATLEAAARVCQQHGAERVFGVVFARSSR